MGHKNKKSLIRQVQERLDSMRAIGQSKHQDKKEGITKGKIYSWGTYSNAANLPSTAETIIIVRIWQTVGSMFKSGWKLGKTFQHTLRSCLRRHCASYMVRA